MSDYDSLYKILDKDVISMGELRKLTADEHVVSIEEKKSDKPSCNKYDVRLDNEELYFVYVKKSIGEILKGFTKKN